MAERLALLALHLLAIATAMLAVSTGSYTLAGIGVGLAFLVGTRF